ncbi:carbohydrate binding family 9 domain-containing protein, partial [bacterium]|nr:carbohydrate binding family 9 domain-containing protein [bacterium]
MKNNWLTIMLVLGIVGILNAEEKPQLSVTVTTADIKIDGILDEPEWHSSNSIQNLTQSEPHKGQQPSYKTTVTVLANHHALFFGIKCQDSERPVTFSKQRDADLSDQDHIKMVIDPFLDGRSGYIFAVNPSGARYDALVNPGGESENPNWDGIWEAATHISENGWSLEIRLPIETLSFRKGLTSWYFNIERRIQRLQEIDRWASASPDYQIG